MSALNSENYEDTLRFLPLVVPPDPTFLSLSDAALEEELYLDASTSGDLYFNLGSLAYNRASEQYAALSMRSEQDYADLIPLIEDARTAAALAERLATDLTRIDELTTQIKRMAELIGAPTR